MNYTYDGMELTEYMSNFETTQYGVIRCGAKYDAKDKETNIRLLVLLFIDRLRRMLKFKGLPESIDQRNLIFTKLRGGYVIIAKAPDGEFRELWGGLGGEPDVHYMPTIAVVANPTFKKSMEYKIHEECVVIPNLSTYQSILPLLYKYATALVENELTINIVDIMARSSLILSADDEQQRISAKAYLDGLKDGEIGVITTNKLVMDDGVEVQLGATDSANILTNLIEYEQYLKASLYNEIGINANWNAKREAIGEAESFLNKDSINTLFDDMVECAKEACEEMNKLWGWNCSVELDGSWKDAEEEEELEKTILENEANNSEVIEEEEVQVDEEESERTE